MAVADDQPLQGKGGKGDNKQSKSGRSDKSCSQYCCLKILVITHALLYLAVGIALLVVGLYFETLKTSYDSVNDALRSPSLITILVGGAMVITAFLGLVGALRESPVLLKIFLAIIIIVFIVQVVLGILAFVFRESAKTVVQKQMMSAIERYHLSRPIQKAVDKVQRDFSCCGAEGPDDWEKNDDYKCDNNKTTTCSVPKSCCKDKEGCGTEIRRTPVSDREQIIYMKGCGNDFMVWVVHNLDMVGALALSVAILQVLGIFVVYFFIVKVQDRRLLYSYRERVGYVA